MSSFDYLQEMLESQGYTVKRIKPSRTEVNASSKSAALRAAKELRKINALYPGKMKQTASILVLGMSGVLERMKSEKSLRGDIRLAFALSMAFVSRFPSIWPYIKHVLETWGISKIFSKFSKVKPENEEPLKPYSFMGETKPGYSFDGNPRDAKGKLPPGWPKDKFVDPNPNEVPPFDDVDLNSRFHFIGDHMDGLPDMDRSVSDLEKDKEWAKNRIYRSVKKGHAIDQVFKERLKEHDDSERASDEAWKEVNGSLVQAFDSAEIAKQTMAKISAIIAKQRSYLKGLNLVYLIGIYEAIKLSHKASGNEEDLKEKPFEIAPHLRDSIDWALKSLKRVPGDEAYKNAIQDIESLC